MLGQDQDAIYPLLAGRFEFLVAKIWDRTESVTKPDQRVAKGHGRNVPPVEASQTMRGGRGDVSKSPAASGGGGAIFSRQTATYVSDHFNHSVERCGNLLVCCSLPADGRAGRQDRGRRRAGGDGRRATGRWSEGGRGGGEARGVAWRAEGEADGTFHLHGCMTVLVHPVWRRGRAGRGGAAAVGVAAGNRGTRAGRWCDAHMMTIPGATTISGGGIWGVDR